ncbi:MAG: hypothetical protein ACYTEL_12325 [Planctomycetota bacterium]
MDVTYLTKKYEADKIALLGLLALGLLIARFMASSRYTGPLKAGRQVIAEIKRKGISSFYHNQSRQSYFLIRDVKPDPVGFTMDTGAELVTGGELNIRMATVLYIQGRFTQDRQDRFVSFQSNDSFEQYHWRSRTVAPRAKTGSEIVMAPDGTLTVIRSGQRKKPPPYKPPANSIPDFLLDLVIMQMLESDFQKIIVETINDDGRIDETVIHRGPDIHSAPDEQLYSFSVGFASRPAETFRYFLDGRGQISRIVIHQDRVYLLERTSPEQVLELFPERSDYILPDEETSNQTEPQYY